MLLIPTALNQVGSIVLSAAPWMKDGKTWYLAQLHELWRCLCQEGMPFPLYSPQAGMQPSTLHPLHISWSKCPSWDCFLPLWGRSDLTSYLSHLQLCFRWLCEAVLIPGPPSKALSSPRLQVCGQRSQGKQTEYRCLPAPCLRLPSRCPDALTFWESAISFLMTSGII